MQKNENERIKPTPVRVVFTKTGALQFISHLDLMRTVTRIVVRADFNVYYTEGFNPKPKLVFALPLSVGTESRMELLDLKVYDAEPDCEEIKRKLMKETVPGIEILDVYRPTTKFRDIKTSDYEITIYNSGITEESASAVNAMTGEPVIVLKRSKSGEGNCDIRDFIKSLSAVSKEGEMTVKATLTADPEHFLNPEYIVTAVKALLGLTDDIAPGKDGHTIMRTAVHGDGRKPFR